MAVEVIMPKLGVDMQEGEILEWKKQEGDVVNEGDILLEIMSDKTNMELEAEDSGVLIKIVHGNGDVVPVTEVIGYLGAEGEVVAETFASQEPAQPIPQEQVKPAPAKEAVQEVAIQRSAGEKVRATPAARATARKLGLDLEVIPGSGAKGRIHKDDVENFKGAQPKVSPLAAKIALDHGLDLSTITVQVLMARL